MQRHVYRENVVRRESDFYSAPLFFFKRQSFSPLVLLSRPATPLRVSRSTFSVLFAFSETRWRERLGDSVITLRNIGNHDRKNAPPPLRRPRCAGRRIVRKSYVGYTLYALGGGRRISLAWGFFENSVVRGAECLDIRPFQAMSAF